MAKPALQTPRPTHTDRNGDTFGAFVLALRDLCNRYLGDDEHLPANSVAAVNEADDDQDRRRADLMATDIRSLRKKALAAGFNAKEVERATKDVLVDALLEDEEGTADAADSDSDEDDDQVDDSNQDDDDEEEEDEEDDEEEDDQDDDDEADEEDDSEEDGEEFDRDDLLGKPLRELKALARTHRGATVDELRGLDRDSVVDIIMSDDEESDDGEDDEEEYYTEDDLRKMPEAELRKLASDLKIKLRPTHRKEAIIRLLLQAGE